MGNRLTFHSGYRNKNGKAYNTKHNQRENFTKKGKEEEAKQNIYWDYTDPARFYVDKGTFSKNEKFFYEQVCGPHVKHQNDRYRKKGNYDRLTTVAKYKEDHPPEEVLLYIGTENVDPEKLKAFYEDWHKYASENFVDNEKGCGIEILNSAMHMDEKTPHIQLRQVYYYTDKYGDIQISQNKALEGLGFERPDPTTKISRKNNAKQTFTAYCREKLFEIAKSHGVELITEPLPKDEVGLSIDEYKARERAREAWKTEQQTLCVKTEKAKQELKDVQEKVEAAKQELEEVEDERFENQKAIYYQKLELGKLGKFQEYLEQQETENEEIIIADDDEDEDETYKEIIMDDGDDDYFDDNEDEEKEQETQDAQGDTQQASQSTVGSGVMPTKDHKTQTPVNEPARPLKNDDAKNNNAREIYHKLHEAAETMTTEEAIRELCK